MIPFESSANLQNTEAATQPTHDGFLYQCRVSPKISTRVGGNRTDVEIAFAVLRSFPGNECVVDKRSSGVSPRTNRPRVPVHISNEVKLVLRHTGG
jgi:hypothetical protein